MTTTKFFCTKSNPWNRDMKNLDHIVHPDATEGDQDDDWYGGISYARRTCPNCGYSWKEELPQ
jgi:hypothetical protein